MTRLDTDEKVSNSVVMQLAAAIATYIGADRMPMRRPIIRPRLTPATGSVNNRKCCRALNDS
jgi:hypothetical protein